MITMYEKSVLIVKKENEKERLDKFLLRSLKNISFAKLQKLIRKGYIKVNSKKKKSSYKIQTNDKVFSSIDLNIKKVEIDEIKEMYRNEIKLLKKKIIFEDKNILVLNKPHGIPVQGGTKIKFNIDLILKHITKDNSESPKLVHRIDKNTSGLLMVAKSKDIANKLSILFKTNKISKTYLSVCKGTPDKMQAKIKLALEKNKINGREIMVVDNSKKSKPSETTYKVLKSNNNLSFLILKPKTGRTHQIRAHLKEIGIPILGDQKYSIAKPNKNYSDRTCIMHLHSRSMSFYLEKKKYNFKAELPEYFIRTLKENKFKFEEY